MQSRLCSSMLGAVVVNVALFLHTNVPVQAAWGWQVTVNASASFTCGEGTSIGCDSPMSGQAAKDCMKNVSNYDCTVVAKAGYTCTHKKLTVLCDSIKGSFTGGVPHAVACINKGMPSMNMTKDSNLKWSPSDPGCTKAASTKKVANANGTAPSSGSKQISALTGVSVLIVANTLM